MTEKGKPLVAVLMGSDSDLSTMQATEKMLDSFGIAYTTRITSAHRSPGKTHDIVAELEKNGAEVFVVGAGLAAHLAGVVASVTSLPVIGVPIGGGSLQGVDALYATVQMPGGVPVATMAIGKHGAKNAGILAAQILATARPELKEKLKAYKQELARSVDEKDSRLVEGTDLPETVGELTREGNQ